MRHAALTALLVCGLAVAGQAGIAPAAARAYAARVDAHFSGLGSAGLGDVWSAARANPSDPNLAPIREAVLAAAQRAVSSAMTASPIEKSDQLHTLMLFSPLLEDTPYPRLIRESYAVLRQSMDQDALQESRASIKRITREIAGDEPVIGLDVPTVWTAVPKAATALTKPSKKSGPIILINPNVSNQPGERPYLGVRTSYINAIKEAGGMPLIAIPSEDPAVMRWYMEQADAFLFIGGDDYPPHLYGQNKHPSVETQSMERARNDISLMRMALEESVKPVLGICAGHQLLNIVLGGTLLQHIPNHRAEQMDAARHEIAVVPGSFLQRLFGTSSLDVNSFHHQAADPANLPSELKVAARALDGTIEAVELSRNPENRFVAGVQWHPEMMASEHRKLIFAAFLAAATSLIPH